MALSLDDKLLGEKTHYYCSSSEDEAEEEEPASSSVPQPDLQQYSGTSTNTGPKGVLNDWRRYKQLETEMRAEQEHEKLNLAQKLTLTCQSHLDEEREKEAAKKKEESLNDELEKELEELEDEFLQEYRQRRMEEMTRVFQSPRFGHLYSLTKDKFVEALDAEKSTVTVIVHIYEDNVRSCETMSTCLACLAAEYPDVKFCQMKATEAQMSQKFSSSGVPALLIYKKGELIGSFVKLSQEFGDEFYSSDVEGFLLEHGFLPDRNVIPVTTSSIRSGTAGAVHDSGTDSDLD